MNLINHALKAILLIAAAGAALWLASSVASIEPSAGASENCPNSTLRFCVFVVV